jgi:mannosidase alpha-like ER degradation enhancer 2
MMVHAWSGYKKYAWGHDELNPISKTAWNWYGNYTLLMTPIDALDTLHIMGLTAEANEAKDLILKNLHFDLPIEVSAFETNIRIVGGLLSGYELMGDEEFLEKAKDIANRLLPIFDTPTGIPFNSVHLMGCVSFATPYAKF